MRPILFTIGSFPIRAYGTLIVIGFLLAMLYIRTVCSRRMANLPEKSPRRVHPDTMLDISVFTLFAGLLGARLLFVLLDLSSYSGRWLDIFKIWAGGMSLHGSLIGGVFALVYLARKNRIRFLVLSDLASPIFAVAYAFGRIGCFLNGCCYGAQCELPWGVRFQDERNPNFLTLPSHPVQIYGTILSLLYFVFLVWWEKRPRRDGAMFYAHVAFYGLYRGLVEFLRAGATSDYLIPSLHLTLTHIISLLMVIGGGIGLAWVKRNRPIA